MNISDLVTIENFVDRIYSTIDSELKAIKQSERNLEHLTIDTLIEALSARAKSSSRPHTDSEEKVFELKVI